MATVIGVTILLYCLGRVKGCFMRLHDRTMTARETKMNQGTCMDFSQTVRA